MGKASSTPGRFGWNRATRLILGASTVLALVASGCSAQRIPTVRVDAQLAALGSIEMQERLVILGVPGCKDSAQLGVLVDPTTVVTPRHVAEAVEAIRATNMLGQALPVGSPTSHKSADPLTQGPMVHYALDGSFQPGPDGMITFRWARGAPSFTATIAWVANGELKTMTAPAKRELGSIQVTVDRSKIGATTDVPAAVIDPSVGIIGWLSSERVFGSPDNLSVLRLDLSASGTSDAGTPNSTCPAAKLAQIAADTSVGHIDLPALPAPTTTTEPPTTTTIPPPDVDLPISTSFSPATVTLDGLGNPCPTGELTVTIDSLEVTEPPSTPDGAFSMVVSITLTNNTTSAITVGELIIPYRTSAGADQMLAFGPDIAPGASSTITEREFVLNRLVGFDTPDLENSILYFPDQFDCTQ